MKIRNCLVSATLPYMLIIFSLLLGFTSPTCANEIAIETYPTLAVTNSEVTIQGYIISPLNGNGNSFESTNKTNLALASSMNASALETIPVQLKEPLRSQFNLVDHPELIGKFVRITGISDTYMKRPGIKPAINIELVDNSSSTNQPIVQNNIPSTPISTVRSGTIGTEYTVSGKIISLVNGWGGNGFYLQGNDGAGIYIYPGSALGYKLGDTVQLTGVLENFRGELQLSKISQHQAIIQSFDTPTIETTISQLETNQQATLISLQNVIVGDIQSDNYENSTFTVTDTQGQSIAVRLDSRTGIKTSDLLTTVNTGDRINLTSILSTYNGKLQLKPFDLAHFVVIEKASDKISSNKQPENVTVGIIQGASHQSPLTNQSVVLKNVVVTYVASSNNFYVQDLVPDEDSKTSDGINVFTGKLNIDVKVGDVLTITGTVEEYLGKGYADRGDTDLTITQINAREVTIEGTAPVPKPVILGVDRVIPIDIIDNDSFAQFDPEQDALDFWESLEGMVVAIDDAKILGPLKNKEVYVTPAINQLTLNNAGGVNLRPEGNNTQIIPLLLKRGNIIVKSGDSFVGRITGPVTYSYTNYKVYVDDTTLPTLQTGSTAPESTTIFPHKDKLTIASYNIENFSANNKSTPDAKVERIAKSFVSDLNSPDIISLIEVQDNNGVINDGTTDASQSAARLITAIKNNGGPDYQYVDIAPENNADGGQEGGNIRVGFLYNPNRVSLSDKPIGTATQSIDWENGELTLSLGRINPTDPIWASVRKTLAAEFIFQGQKVVVIANHFNSKRGDNGLYGKIQPAIFNSETKRHQLAQMIANFTQEGINQNPEANIIMLGDFNDYEFTKTIQILEAGGMVNLVSRHDETDRFSYFYNGNNQSLDNILISTNLSNRYNFDMVHVNSVFMEEHGRASDHDPLLVQIDFTPIKQGDAVQKDDPDNTQQERPNNNEQTLDNMTNPNEQQSKAISSGTVEKEKSNQQKILPRTGQKENEMIIFLGFTLLNICVITKKKYS
ncbi:DUF6359 domain-containing protein [Streptococcus suis]|nr:DUF6359 domain-containing protein [Streptococcus suis]